MPPKKKIKISVKDLHKAFGSKKVLDGVSIDVTEGESLVVIGGSGTGKSVFIKNIIGLMKPDQGSIVVDGLQLNNLSEREREDVMPKFGFLFQGGALFDSLKVWENIAFGLINYKKMNRKDAKEIAMSKLI